MNRQIKLSNSIVCRIPVSHRTHTISNLRWVLKNIHLTKTEASEVIDALKSLQSANINYLRSKTC